MGRERGATIEIFTLVRAHAARATAFDVSPEGSRALPGTGQNRVVTEIIETAVLWALKAV